ncbi:MAG: type II toxin-antitoxin system RelE/ParE family toxin [Pseudomonadota bacterium]
MDFSFASKKLKKQLSDDAQMKKAFGENAKKLQLRLGVLRNATCLADVPNGPPDRCHQLHENRDEHFAVVLRRNWRLEFQVDHSPIPRKNDGGIDLNQVTSIKILGVVDYH